MQLFNLYFVICFFWVELGVVHGNKTNGKENINKNTGQIKLADN